MKAPLPADEMRRLETLRQYDVLDSLPEKAFDDLALVATHICQTPIAMISFVDEKRQWFKSRIGTDKKETSRDIAFCAHAILEPGRVFEIPDARLDPRFCDNELVTTDPQVCFYAGAPLISPEGHALGALCVMDRVPHQLTSEQQDALLALGRLVMAQLVSRRQARQLVDEAAERNRAETLLQEQFDQLSISKTEADRLLVLGQKSRRALLSVLEDEKLASQNLRASEERFRELAENINEVFWITSPATQEMLYISPAYEKIWGRTCESLYARPQDWLDAIHPEDRDRVLQSALTSQAEGKYNEEYRIIRPDKSIRWICDRAFPVCNQSGELERVVGVARDITDTRRLEDQFRQSQKMESIGQLAGGVAHDFNNILAVIQLQAGMLRTEPLTSGQSEIAAEIEMAANRAANLTRQLLLFSRKQVMQPRDLSIKEVVTNMARMLQRVLDENIRVEYKFSPQPMLIRADAGMMDQILLNLAVNARDAMPKGGRIIIETAAADFDEVIAARSPQSRPGHFVCLSVSDTGCGIPAENLARIFEPFFTTKDVGKGTGLGLATVFGIVQQHLGWINVYSEVGRGTTFRIYLPRLVSATEKTAGWSSPLLTRGGNETILLVEDDIALSKSIQVALSRLGYRVLVAATGHQALEVWHRHHTEINLVLTDLMMPDGMNGCELASKLLMEEPGLKVLFASGYSAEIAGKDLVLEEGVNFLSKPFEAHKLAETIRLCLDK